MFYNEYLNDDYLEELYHNYSMDYLKGMDMNNFYEIYNVFKKYKFDYIEEIILKYLDIFELDKEVVEEKIGNLIKILGSNYVDIISDDFNYLEYIARS